MPSLLALLAADSERAHLQVVRPFRLAEPTMYAILMHLRCMQIVDSPILAFSP